MVKRLLDSPLSYLVLLILISRLAMSLVGVKFDSNPLHEDYTQYLDTGSLRHHLLASLWVWHSQPPLFNAFLGVILKLFPSSYNAAFHDCYLLFALVLTMCLYSLQRRLGLGQSSSFILTLLFMVSPAVILHENWLFYSYPLTTLLVLSALCLSYFLERGTFLTALGYFGVLTFLTLSQSMFAAIWFFMILAGHLVFQPALRKVTLAAGLPCSVIIVAMVVRVHSLTGSYSPGDVFASMQLAVNTIHALPNKKEPIVLATQGRISLVSLNPPYLSLSKYAPDFVPNVPRTGNLLLDDEFKPGGEHFRNFNCLGYVQLARVIRRDSLYVLFHQPASYLRRIAKQFSAEYFLPAEEHPPFFDDYPNKRVVQKWSWFFSRFVLWQPRINSSSLLLMALVLSSVFGLGLLIRHRPNLVNIGVPAFMLFNILYVSFLTILLTAEELNRYRFFIDPFVLVGAALSVGLLRFPSSRTSRAGSARGLTR